MICNANKQPWNNNNQGSTINNNNYHKHQEQWWQWRSSGHSNQSFRAPVLNGKPHHCCCRTMNTHSLTHSKQLPNLQFFSLHLHSYDSTQLFFFSGACSGLQKIMVSFSNILFEISLLFLHLPSNQSPPPPHLHNHSCF